MAKKESISALKRYNRRKELHNYSIQTRKIWTESELLKIYKNEEKYVDWKWAKYFSTSIKSIQHIKYKLKIASKISDIEKYIVDLATNYSVKKLKELM